MHQATVLRAVPYKFDKLPTLTREEAALWNFYCRVGPAEQDWTAWISDIFGHLFERRAGMEVKLAQTHLVDAQFGEKVLSFGSKQELAIGREAGNDVVLSAPAIAGHHARLTVREGRAYLQDLGTRLGTYLWDKRITSNEPQALASGDQFTVFPYCFRVLLEECWATDDKVTISQCSLNPGETASFLAAAGAGWHTVTVSAHPSGERAWVQADNAFKMRLEGRLLEPLGLDAIRERLPSDDSLLAFVILSLLERANRKLRFPVQFMLGTADPLSATDRGRGMLLRFAVATSEFTGQLRVFLPFSLLSRCISDASASPSAYPELLCWHFPVSLGNVDLTMQDIDQLVPGDILVAQRHTALLFPNDFTKGWSMAPDGSNTARFRLDKYFEGKITVDSGAEPSAEATKPDIQSLPLRLYVVLGEKEYTLGDIQALTPGAIVELDLSKSEPVRLMVNGKVLGEGELVDVEGNLAVKVLRWRSA